MTDAVRKLDGPSILPASGGDPKQLVVLLHGYGADGNDLISLASDWRKALPDAAFLSPHAPEPCAASPFGGRQWFELTMRNPEERWRGVQKAAPDLQAYLDRQLETYGLGDDALALVGFSQGTMMGLYVAPRRDEQLACIVGFSGRLVANDDLATAAKVRPPVLLVHGDQDQMIAVSELSAAETALRAAGFDVQSHISRGVGHGIAPDGLTLALRFLQRHLGTGEG